MEGYFAEIRLWAANFAPRNWAFCNGQIISIAQNTALFSLLGTTYGGNGTTTFALPNLAGRVVVGTGSGPGLSNRVLGEMAGSENVTLLANQIPGHVHSIAKTTTAGTDIASNTFLVGASGETAQPGSSGNAGGNASHSNMQPYLVLNYIICMYGIYPSRS
jgi:microcystin-dependent protein